MLATEIIAHRGLSSLCPENTLVSIEGAHKVGATWVELDAQVLKDGRVIIMHDHEISRTTNSQGLVSDLTILDVQDIDAGSWFDPRFKNEKIPTLREALELIYELKMGLVLELKYHQLYHDALALEEQKLLVEKIMKALAKAPSPPKGLLVVSFYRRFLKWARECNNKVALGCLHTEFAKDYLEFAKSIQAKSLHFPKEFLLGQRKDSKLFDASHIKKIKEANMDLFAFTVNDANLAKPLFDLGVDSIVSDYPQYFKNYLP